MKKLEGYIQVHQGVVLPEDAFDRLMNTLAKLFKSTASTLAKSCNRFQEEPFTRELVESTVWRLCANSDNLSQDIPALFYSKFNFSAKEEIRFESIKPVKDKYVTGVRVLTGHYAPGELSFKFTRREVERILYRCGYTGGKYVAGRLEDCLPGLISLAHLASFAECPRILKKILESDDIVAFNRRNIIGYRVHARECPHGYHGRCRECPLSVEDCLASYKEKTYND